VLNGTSSCGKTTIARAFQEAAPTRFLNFSIDSILLALPQREIDGITNGDDLSGLEIPKLVRAYYECVRQLLDLGHHLVIDNAIVARYQAEHLVTAVSSHRALMVGVQCAADVLAQRERERGDRRKGMALAQLERIHSWLSYDLLIDSAQLSASEAAQRIVAALEAGTNGALERTRAKLSAS
jgi:chloramphenicol 3-O phosphotransferase